MKRTFKGFHITAPVDSFELVAGDGTRVGVCIQPPTTGHLHVSFGGDADDDTDFILDAGTAHIMLMRDVWGDRITKRINVTLAGAGEAMITTLHDA